MKSFLIAFSTYVLFISVGIHAVSSSLHKSTEIHCANNVQSACDYLARVRK